MSAAAGHTPCNTSWSTTLARSGQLHACQLNSLRQHNFTPSGLDPPPRRTSDDKLAWNGRTPVWEQRIPPWQSNRLQPRPSRYELPRLITQRHKPAFVINQSLLFSPRCANALRRRPWPGAPYPSLTLTSRSSLPHLLLSSAHGLMPSGLSGATHPLMPVPVRAEYEPEVSAAVGRRWAGCNLGELHEHVLPPHPPPPAATSPMASTKILQQHLQRSVAAIEQELSYCF
jgi:hypothetical protein